MLLVLQVVFVLASTDTALSTKQQRLNKDDDTKFIFEPDSEGHVSVIKL